MACITAGSGQEFCDGEYVGFCVREKTKNGFPGVVSLTATGRIIATGPCESCRTTITATLYTP
jgi:hypothetical protein